RQPDDERSHRIAPVSGGGGDQRLFDPVFPFLTETSRSATLPSIGLPLRGSRTRLRCALDRELNPPCWPAELVRAVLLPPGREAAVIPLVLPRLGDESRSDGLPFEPRFSDEEPARGESDGFTRLQRPAHDAHLPGVPRTGHDLQFPADTILHCRQELVEERL